MRRLLSIVGWLLLLILLSGNRPTHAVIQGLQDEVAQLRRLLSLQRVESADLEKRKGDGETQAQQTTGESEKEEVKGDAKAEETLREVKQEKPEPGARDPGGSVERSPSVRFTCESGALFVFNLERLPRRVGSSPVGCWSRIWEIRAVCLRMIRGCGRCLMA